MASRRTLRLYERYEKQFGKPDLILAHSVTWAGYAASSLITGKLWDSIPGGGAPEFFCLEYRGGHAGW